MKIALIKPAMTDELSRKNFLTWNVEPLVMAILKSLTPSDVEVSFYDDRIEAIPFDAACDMVGITVDTSTARRAYRISEEFRKRGVSVVLGGYHPTLIPEEAGRYADAVVVGCVEGIWGEIIRDAKNRRLKRVYCSDDFSFSRIAPDRSIFRNKRYLPLAPIEASRGCPFFCEFCSTSAVYKGKVIYKRIEDVKREIEESGRKLIMFVDENITANSKRAVELFEGLAPMNILWIGQVAPNILLRKDIISLLRRSGCVGLLIGFESINRKSLRKMKKDAAVPVDYNKLIDILHSRGIAVYASFLAGYSNGSEDVHDAYKRLLRKKVALAGFNPLTPYPGTPLYHRFLQEGKLRREDWWMDEPYPYWEFVYFEKERGDKDGLAEELTALRRRFYSFSSILRRLNTNLLLMSPALFFFHLLLEVTGCFEVKAKERIFANG